MYEQTTPQSVTIGAVAVSFLFSVSEASPKCVRKAATVAIIGDGAFLPYVEL